MGLSGEGGGTGARAGRGTRAHQEVHDTEHRPVLCCAGGPRGPGSRPHERLGELVVEVLGLRRHLRVAHGLLLLLLRRCLHWDGGQHPCQDERVGERRVPPSTRGRAAPHWVLAHLPLGASEVPVGHSRVPTGAVARPTGAFRLPHWGVSFAPLGRFVFPTGAFRFPHWGTRALPVGHSRAPLGKVARPTGEVARPTGKVARSQWDLARSHWDGEWGLTSATQNASGSTRARLARPTGSLAGGEAPSASPTRRRESLSPFPTGRPRHYRVRATSSGGPSYLPTRFVIR